MPANPCRSRDGLTRRQFLTGAPAAAGSLAISVACRPIRVAPDATAQEPEVTPRAYFPLVMKRYSLPKVVHVHDNEATYWDFSTGWYGDHVDQHVVYEMVNQGLMQLTGTTNRAATWQALIPDYVPGQRVAIKVNLNNAPSEDDSDNVIDALIEPVNGVVRGLKEIGVAESDIWVYDAVRAIPNRFRNRCDFPSVQFSGGWGANAQGFSDREMVTFEPPLAEHPISNVLANADYLINMPIMKRHGGACATLSFKNHFGSIKDCDTLHGYTYPRRSNYKSHYSPLVDIYKNSHFVGKTVLIIGDGLYGCWPTNWVEPEPWVTFGNQAPNSLFFSKDPVAIDCVMYDFLEAEVGVESGGDDYLVLAAQEGLGVFEHRAPGAVGPEEWYSLIDYVYLDGV